MIPLARFAACSEDLNLAIFLASDESSVITGAEHVIDGGMTAARDNAKMSLPGVRPQPGEGVLNFAICFQPIAFPS
jgi:enoyl-ACP reductase-like protein